MIRISIVVVTALARGSSLQEVSSNLAATGTWRFREWIGTTTTLGAQYVNSSFRQNIAEGDDLPPGTQTAGAAAIEGASESTALSKTLGFFIEEQLAFNDRLFVTGKWWPRVFEIKVIKK